ncbi:MAG TPA: amino acid adenylation domain-containing protein [Pyrinomonadaceae bacterium]
MTQGESGILVLDRELVEAQQYWTSRLGRGVTGANIRLDFPRPEKNSGPSASMEFALPETCLHKLSGLTGESHFLQYTTLLAALKLCLHKYTGRRDITVGSPSLLNSEEPAGGSNLVVILDDVDRKLTFRQLLLNVRTTLLEAYERQDYPFQRLVRDLGLSLDQPQSPLFDVVMSLVPLHAPVLNVGQDMTLCWRHVDGQMILGVTYREELFRHDSIQRFVGHYFHLLQQALDYSDRPVCEFSLCTEVEQHQLLLEWNDTKVDFVFDKNLAQLFAMQVERTPDAVALVSSDSHLSYDYVNRRANQLARHLESLGVGPQSRVGLCLGRSLEMVLALLGIVKAGAAYVPLDASYPQERLAFMMEDAQLSVVVTQVSELKSLPSDSKQQFVCLDRDWPSISVASTENPSIASVAEQVVYVSYTSGSTGQPKGVEVTHRGIERLLLGVDYVQLDQRQRFTQLAPLAFDAASFEIWGALLHGGCCVLLPERLPPPKELGRVIRDEQITILWVTTALFNLMIVEAAGAMRGLRQIFFGGEVCSARHLQSALEYLPQTQIVHCYGPTEGTTFTTCCNIDARRIAEDGTVRIGRPISNTQVYVLDEEKGLVPQGVPGELYVGGEGLATGYLHRPDITAERFVPNPFSSKGGSRLYRTGDLVRFERDGLLEFQGRMDHQVKVRGFRIELGEVECVLRKFPGLQQVVVTVHEREPGDRRLIAYVVVAGSQDILPRRLRDFLSERLPDYMIPTEFVLLETLPLTASGKVDRRALPVPELSGFERQQPYVKPRTKSEQILAEVWAEVLGLERVGIRDNYFDLGGDSIRSLRVMSKAQERGLTITLEDLFDYSTIERLAEVCDPEAPATETNAALPPFSLISDEDRSLLPNGIEDAYPLTRMQAGMVFHTEFSPETPVYHDVFSFHIRAHLDAEIFRQTTRDLLARHAVLRTSFDLTTYSEPLQLVHETVELPFEVHDIVHLTAAEQDTFLAAALEAEKKRAFDWSQDSLLCFKIFPRDHDTFQLMLSMHHAILDGWSLATLFSELFKHYFYLLGLTSEDIEPAPRTLFREYVALEQKAMGSEESRRFWHERMRGREFTRLPRWSGTKSGDAVPQKRLHVTLIPSAVSDVLNRLSQVIDAPMKSLLLAAHIRVLSMLSGLDDVLTGLVFHGRPEVTDGERVLGLFLNTLPFRYRLEDETWRQLVSSVFGAERQMLQHRWFPMAELQHQLGDDRLFEVAFSVQHFHVYQTLEGFDERMALIGGEGITETSFTLMVTFDQDPFTARLQLSLSYDDQELHADQIDAISGYYLKALSLMSQNPGAAYLSQSLLSDAERSWLLREWDQVTAAGGPTTVHAYFEQQAAERADAIALISDQHYLSYDSLNRSANRLAHRLIALGVAPDTFVGLSFERSVQMVISLLAILKAGAAYVPLDPAYPKERLSLMIEETGLETILTDRLHSDGVAECGATLVLVDDVKGDPAPDYNPQLQLSDEQLAYLSFTSASTGRPKAVAIPHRAVVRLVIRSQYASFGPNERIMLGAPLNFDASTFEVWGALMNGGACVLLPERVPDGALLERLVSEQNVTTMWLTSSLFNSIVDEDVNRLRGLEQLLVGGEALSVRHVQLAQNSLTGTKLINGYGPTEATTFASTYEIKEPLTGSERSIPIGKPIAETELYVLGRRMELAPRGASGELYIGGTGLARGYWGAPDLTAEKFVPNPYAQSAGERLYRTGDMVKYGTAVDLEYEGRVDLQVKVRGYRIEPGEIEEVLKACMGVKNVVVEVRPGPGGEGKQLVAFVVAESGDAHDWRRYLRERLPEHMVPGLYVRMDAIPLTENGKVDRRALPDSIHLQTSSNPNEAAPRNVTEELLAGIWEQVLKLGPVGVHTSFFDLGGHSLLATQVVSRMREVFQIEMPLRNLFESPTVAELARIVEELRRKPGTAARVDPIQAGVRKEPVPLSFAQQRLWFMDHIVGHSGVHLVAEALGLVGELNLSSLEQSVNEVVRRHESLRTRIGVSQGEATQIIAPHLLLSIPLVDLSGLSTTEQRSHCRRLCADEAKRKMDLRQGSLVRVHLLKLGPREYVLLLVVHHIITDGWSRSVFLSEMGSLYEAYIQGRPSPLQELSVQYADYAIWQRQLLQGEVLEEQTSYWRNKLAGVPRTLDLPLLQARPARQTFHSGSQSLTIPRNEVELIKSLGRKEGSTLFMTLLAAFQTVLHGYSGQDNICVVTPVANRQRPEVEGLIGFFVNMLAMHTDFSGDPTFRQVLRRVRGVTLDAYAHQDLPFEKVVDALQLERDTGYASVAQAVFSLNNQAPATLTLPGLKLQPVDIELKTIEHDLTFLMQENPDGLNGVMIYKSDLIDRSLIAAMLAHFRRILQLAVEQPDVRILDLPWREDRPRTMPGAIAGLSTSDEIADFDFSF